MFYYWMRHPIRGDMNVPPDKVALYKAAGFEIVQKVETFEVVESEKPKAPAQIEAPAPKKRRAKKG